MFTPRPQSATTILAVDDDRGILDLLESVLQSAGYSYGEISAQTGDSHRTIERQIARALQLEVNKRRDLAEHPQLVCLLGQRRYPLSERVDQELGAGEIGGDSGALGFEVA